MLIPSLETISSDRDTRRDDAAIGCQPRRYIVSVSYLTLFFLLFLFPFFSPPSHESATKSPANLIELLSPTESGAEL